MNINKLKSFIAAVFLIASCNNIYSTELSVNNSSLLTSDNVRKIENITGYQFRNRQLLRNVFNHHSLYMASKFQQLEFIGDKVIAAIIALNTFNKNKQVSILQKEVENKTINKYLAKISKDLGLYNLIHYNRDNSSETIAADAFEALVGAMQLDFEHHPHQISPAAIKFVLKAFDMPVTQKLSHRNLSQVSLRDTNHFDENRGTSHYENADRSTETAAIAAVAVAGLMGAGIGALWNWWSGSPDYKKMYEECRLKKNLYKSLCVVMGSMLCWPYISPYFGFTKTIPQT